MCSMRNISKKTNHKKILNAKQIQMSEFKNEENHYAGKGYSCLSGCDSGFRACLESRI